MNGKSIRSPGNPSDNEEIERIVSGEKPEKVVFDRKGIFLTPTSDDRPFGHQHVDFLSALLAKVGAKIDDPDVQFQTANFQALFGIIAGLVVIVGFLFRVFLSRVPTAQRKTAAYQMLLFGFLGLGFMLFEVVLIERASLLLGHPTIGLITILTALLLALSAGSALSGLFRLENRKNAPKIFAVFSSALAVAVMPFLLPELLPWIREHVPTFWRPPLISAVVFIASIPLGIFLPTAIRVIGGMKAASVASCWAIIDFCIMNATISAKKKGVRIGGSTSGVWTGTGQDR